METNPKINWQDYLIICLKRKWFFIIPFVGVFLISVMAGFILPKSYEAKAIILVEEGKMVNPLLQNIAVSSSVGTRLHKLREEILSWPRLLQLVEEMKLNKDIRNPLELEMLIMGIRRDINLQMKGSDIILISYQSQDPRTTQEVVNTLCDILIRKNILAQTEEADSAILFIEEQLKTYKAKLEESEEALRKFKETYGLQMPLATRINSELAQLESELTNALVDCTEDHPRVKESRRRITSLREKRLQQLHETAKNMESGENMNYVDIADSIPKQEEALARLTRGREINEQVYAMLLQRLETARISKQLENSENKTKFKIIEPARLPLRPTKPNKVKIDFLGLMLGGMIGFGCVYLVEYTDQSFKTAEDLKQAFNLPVFGTISKIITQKDLKRKRIVSKKIIILISIIAPLLIIISAVIIKIAF
ncbi:MAG: GNVR domain-containing protein [Candidatus Omnitrophota bacterium]